MQRKTHTFPACSHVTTPYEPTELFSFPKCRLQPLTSVASFTLSLCTGNASLVHILNTCPCLALTGPPSRCTPVLQFLHALQSSLFLYTFPIIPCSGAGVFRAYRMEGKKNNFSSTLLESWLRFPDNKRQINREKQILMTYISPVYMGDTQGNRAPPQSSSSHHLKYHLQPNLKDFGGGEEASYGRL